MPTKAHVGTITIFSHKLLEWIRESDGTTTSAVAALDKDVTPSIGSLHLSRYSNIVYVLDPRAGIKEFTDQTYEIVLIKVSYPNIRFM